MREGQQTGVVVVWVGNGLEAHVGKLGGNLSGTFRGFGFDNESVWAPAHNTDVSSSAELAGGIKPWRIL